MCSNPILLGGFAPFIAEILGCRIVLPKLNPIGDLEKALPAPEGKDMS